MINYEDEDHSRLPFFNEASVTQGYKDNFLKICKVACINPNSVKLILELGSGYGRVTKSIVEAFANATIQAVDIDDKLGKVKEYSKVNFFQGQFVDILQSNVVFPPDILIMKDMGPNHGFTKDNVSLLKRFGSETIISNGDNGMLEFTPWFQNFFKVTVGPNEIEPNRFNLLGWKVIKRR